MMNGTYRALLTVTPPARFNFWRTVMSHGWCSLPPFRVDQNRRSLARLVRIDGRHLVDCTITRRGNKLKISATSHVHLTAHHRREIKKQIGTCLRLNEDYSSFHAEAAKHRRYKWIAAKGVGRLLRAPTVFEDVVKMMLTTNCSWSLTETMVGNLLKELGDPFGNDQHDFPSPLALAGATESFVRKRVRAGYRSPFLIEFGERVASGRLDVESWRTTDMPTEDLFKAVCSVKGIGEYAAGNILRLLGRYDYLALDSWVRRKFSEIHHRGRSVGDRTIQRFYAQYGSWRGLLFWLDMTEHWFDQKFPFGND